MPRRASRSPVRRRPCPCRPRSGTSRPRAAHRVPDAAFVHAHASSRETGPAARRPSPEPPGPPPAPGSRSAQRPSLETEDARARTRRRRRRPSGPTDAHEPAGLVRAGEALVGTVQAQPSAVRCATRTVPSVPSPAAIQAGPSGPPAMDHTARSGCVHLGPAGTVIARQAVGRPDPDAPVRSPRGSPGPDSRAAPRRLVEPMPRGAVPPRHPAGARRGRVPEPPDPQLPRESDEQGGALICSLANAIPVHRFAVATVQRR